jgi:DNA polymerase III epsilon subunit-like protein
MRHIMLDLETLGTLPDAAVIAIGACAFDPNADNVSANDLFDRVIMLESARAHGSVDRSTELWWEAQSAEARQHIFSEQAQRDALSLPTAVQHFNDFVGGRDTAVWGNGATFDNVVIRSAFRSCGIDPVWSFRNDKCYRTVINLISKDKQPEFVRQGTAHNALDDAVTQAVFLQKCLKALGITL